MAGAQELINLLREKKLTIGAVESLTGGLFGATICGIPGASDVYKGGLITYDPSEKTALANVPEQVIKENGVVSGKVASMMASGGAKALKVDVCLSCTGNAGPTACPGCAPVGTVFVGAYYRGNVWVFPLQFQGERNQIRQQTVDTMIAAAQALFVVPPKPDADLPKDAIKIRIKS